MISKSFLDDTKAVSNFCLQYGISFLGLFGSYARKQQKIDSDMDILVEFKKPVTYFQLLSAEEELGLKLHVKVDLVTKNALHSKVRPYVAKDLQIIYGQKPANLY